jgi:hypothetical protein
MADASVFQSSFLGGEWSPLAQGRADSPDYRRALGVCVNAIPTAEGAWTRRGGFLNCGAAYGGRQAIIRPFLLPNNTPCYLELTYFGGNSALRFWVPDAAQRTFVRLTSETRTLSAISGATPAAVTVTGAESWSTGDDVVFSLGASATIGPSRALLQQRDFIITVVNTTHFTIADGITSAAINGAALSYSSSGSDTVSKVLAFALPYTTLAAVQAVRVVKADNFAILLSPGYPPVALYWNGSTFTLTSPAGTSQLDGPYLDPLIGSGGGQLGLSTGHVNANWLSSPTQFIIDDGAYTFTSNDVGKLLRIWNQPPAYSDAINYSSQTISSGVPAIVTYQGSYWRIADFGSASAGFMPAGVAPGTTFQNTHAGITATHIPWVPFPQAANWMITVITSIVSGSTAAITFLSGIVSYPSDGTNTTCDMWQLGLFGPGQFPTSGAYRQGRLYLGGAQLNRADLSVADALDPWKVQAASGTLPANAFSPTDQFGNVGDANAIAAVMNDAELNSIFAFTPVKAGMIALTPGGEFLIDSSTLNDGLTPATTKADKVSQYKAANMEPLRIGVVTVFVQAAGREVLEYFADAFTGAPVGRPLNEFSKHLTPQGLAEIRYQHERVPVIWARRNTNQLIGCTYRRLTTFSSQPPEFAAWHEHVHGGGGAIESICTGPRPDGLSDCVMAIVNVAGVRYVEMLTDIFDEGLTLPMAMHVDTAAVVGGSDNNSSTLTVYGLDQYVGETVSIWLGGLDCNDHVVAAGGTITIPYGSDPGGFLTAAYLNSLTGGWTFGAPFDVWLSGVRTRIEVPCVVGFNYTSQGQTLRSLGQNESKTPTGDSLGMTRRSHMFSAYMTQTVSGGLYFGPDFNNLLQTHFTVSLQNPTLLTTKDLFTGVWQDELNDDYSFDGTLAWQVTRPTPATVGAVTTFTDTQER